MLALLAVSLGVLALGGIAGFVLHDMLLRRVRALHPEIWVALGSPDRTFDDGGLAGCRAARRLYRQPALRHRCSPKLVALIKCTRAYGRVYLVLVIVTLAFLMVWLGRIE
jgi:hypothetical protein